MTYAPTEERKAFLRTIFKTVKPSQWHKAVGESITREEWQYLSTQWAAYNEKQNKKLEEDWQ